jgi:hypothetical protein
MAVLPHRLQGQPEGVSVLEEVILAAEGAAWDQERMGMEDSEDEVVREGVEALGKGLFRLENGEGVRDYLRGLAEVIVATVEAGLVEVEGDIKESSRTMISTKEKLFICLGR